MIRNIDDIFNSEFGFRIDVFYYQQPSGSQLFEGNVNKSAFLAVRLLRTIPLLFDGIAYAERKGIPPVFFIFFVIK